MVNQYENYSTDKQTGLLGEPSSRSVIRII